MAIPLKVSVYKGADFIGEQRYDRDIIKIGRLASAHLKLEDPKVSRIHAVIEVSSDGAELSIIDMGSSEGTFVNGERISKERLKDGDEIKVGDCRLVLSLDAAPIAPGLPGGMSVPPQGSAPQAGLQWAQLAPENSPTGVFSPVNPLAAQVAWSQPPSTGAAFAQQVHALASMPPAPPMGTPSMAPQPAAPDPVAYHAAQMAYAAQIAAQSASLAAQSASAAAQPLPYAQPAMSIPPGAYAQPQAALGYAPHASIPPGYAQPGYAPGPPPPPMLPPPPPATDVAHPPVNGWHAQQAPRTPWGSVPNNLASEGVPESERALELKLIWGDSLLKAINVTTEPVVTFGDQEELVGWGPFQTLKTCDLEAPSKGLPSPRFPIAVSRSQTGASYVITLHSSFSGHVEKHDGTIVSLQEIVSGGRVERGELPETWLYNLNAEETLYVKHGALTVQARYVRKTRLVPIPWAETLNYTWLNTFILVAFFNALLVASLLATPRNSESLEDQLFKNPNRFAQFRLTPEQKKKQESFLAKLKAGDQGAKARKDEGKAGRKDYDKNKPQGRLAVKAVDPTDKEIAKSTLSKLFENGNRSASQIFGTGGLGGELKGALGGVTGAQIGDASGLGGLGARGAGPGGGGLSSNSVGIGALGTSGRGGGGDGSYGTGVGNLGKKADRDINITAGNPVIMGSLDKELIRKVIEAHKAQIRYCYEKELVRTPGLFGKIEMEWTIGADGLVKDAKPKASTMNNDEVDRCIASKIRTWEFPKPKGGGVVIVRYPFVFKTSG